MLQFLSVTAENTQKNQEFEGHQNILEMIFVIFSDFTIKLFNKNR